VGVSAKSFTPSNTLVICFVTKKKCQCPEFEEHPDGKGGRSREVLGKLRDSIFSASSH
jgi:hypothetical protein